MPQLKTIKHVETTTMEPAPGPFASFNINAVSVSWQVRIKDNVGDSSEQISHSQLNQQTFRPTTPIKASRFEALLKGHPNQDLVNYVITGFKQGFLLKYQVPRVNRQLQNLKLAFQFKDKL